MEQIVVNKPSGAKIVLGGSDPVVSITRAEQRCALMGEDVVEVTVESSVALNVQVLDWIMVYGKIYMLYELPTVSRVNANRIAYTYTFQATVHEMQRLVIKNTDTAGVYFIAEFT